MCLLLIPFGFGLVKVQNVIDIFNLRSVITKYTTPQYLTAKNHKDSAYPGAHQYVVCLPTWQRCVPVLLGVLCPLIGRPMSGLRSRRVWFQLSDK
jgi:hypothetical protein